jgi:hypothetical protein
VVRIGEGIVVHRVLVGKPEGRRPLERTRRRWVDNIKKVLQKEGRGNGVNELSRSIKCGEFLD